MLCVLEGAAVAEWLRRLPVCGHQPLTSEACYLASSGDVLPVTCRMSVFFVGHSGFPPTLAVTILGHTRTLRLYSQYLERKSRQLPLEGHQVGTADTAAVPDAVRSLNAVRNETTLMMSTSESSGELESCYGVSGNEGICFTSMLASQLGILHIFVLIEIAFL